MSPTVKYVYIMPWWPANRLEWYSIIILSVHTSDIANNAVSTSGAVMILNNNESSNIYFSSSVSTFQIAVFVLYNVFWAKHRYKSLKYGLIKYPSCISFTVAGKCIPLRTFLWIIFNILLKWACRSKKFSTSLPVLSRLFNSCCSWKCALSGLWYVSEITPYWNGEFSSKLIVLGQYPINLQEFGVKLFLLV